MHNNLNLGKIKELLFLKVSKYMQGSFTFPKTCEGQTCFTEVSTVHEACSEHLGQPVLSPRTQVCSPVFFRDRDFLNYIWFLMYKTLDNVTKYTITFCMIDMFISLYGVLF